jgi:hypothetical protein
MDIFERLAAPFPPGRISWRVGSTNKDKTKGMALAYIDARDVMNRLDEVVGPTNWQARYPHAGAKTVCEIDIWVEGRGWVTKADGAGDTDVEAQKGSLSDAFKRAAVRWGVGRYLYDLASPWVEIEAFGRSYAITAAAKQRLAKIIGAPPPSTEEAHIEPGPSPRELAIKALNACKGLEAVKDLWRKDAPGWEQVMSAEDFAAVTKVKDALKITHTVTGGKQTQDNPFAQSEAA